MGMRAWCGNERYWFRTRYNDFVQDWHWIIKSWKLMNCGTGYFFMMSEVPNVTWNPDTKFQDCHCFW